MSNVCVLPAVASRPRTKRRNTSSILRTDQTRLVPPPVVTGHPASPGRQVPGPKELREAKARRDRLMQRFMKARPPYWVFFPPCGTG